MISYMTTLANSIIGVSVLAMPYCFKQCGIILATVMLFLSSILSRLACHFLIKSAVMSRRRNYEFLAFHAFGNMGKFLVELFIIGFLLGTCVAYFVVIGDLGPEFVGKIIHRNPEDIRTTLLIMSAVTIILPLGLLRNIDSLSSVCTATIIFYVILVIKVISESMTHILAEDWYAHVYYWRPAGILQCVPIFSMALFCQTQLFEIYETIPNASLDKMNAVVKGALNMCTSVYLCVGFFGYIAFCTQPFTGNILMSFEPNLTSEAMKIGFVFSVAFSFPLVIFPCRASLNSLLYRRVAIHDVLNYIPETRFRCLTFIIVGISLVIGILIPNIEFVLGLVGSTIGVMICLIFPAAFFISINNKNTNETILAYFIIIIGFWIVTLGTYANLYAMEESTNNKNFINDPNEFHNRNHHIPLDVQENVMQLPNLINTNNQIDSKLPETKVIVPDIRPEPPVPVDQEKLIAPKEILKKSATIPLKLNKLAESSKDINIDKLIDSKIEDDKAKSQDDLFNHLNDQIDNKELKQAVNNNNNVNSNNNLINIDAIKREESELADNNNVNSNNNLINIDAIKKEELELAAETDQKKMEDQKQQEKLRKPMIKQEVEGIHHIEEPVNNQIANEKVIAPNLKANLKVLEESNNEPKKIRGHILDALTKGASKEESVKNLTNENKRANNVNNEVKVDDKRTAPLPIVLKMNNQTLQMKSDTANVDNMPALARRDILHKHDREKRNVVNVSNKDDKIILENDKPSINVVDEQSSICQQEREKSLDKEKLKKQLTLDNSETDMNTTNEEMQQDMTSSPQDKANLERLIKTNAYLSQQDFTEKTISVTSNVILDKQFTQLKKRDLKAVKSENYPT